MKNKDFISIGFVSNDHLAIVPFIPMDTKVKMLSHAIIGGGPAGNAAAGAVALGMDVAFAGTVGDDADGRMILDEFAREGVDTSMIKVRKGATSAIAYLWVEEKTGNRSCVWTREGLTELTADEIDPEAVAKAKVLHLDGHNAAGAIAAAKVAREAGVLVNYDAGTHRDGMQELLELADLMVCSEEFILKLTGLKDAEEAVRQVYAKYKPKVCGATMGVRGEGLRRHDGRARVDVLRRQGLREVPGVPRGEGRGYDRLRRPVPHRLRDPLPRDARPHGVPALRRGRVRAQVPRPLRPSAYRAHPRRGRGVPRCALMLV